MTDCIFCKISKKKCRRSSSTKTPTSSPLRTSRRKRPRISSSVRASIQKLGDASEQDSLLLGRTLLVAAKLAAERNLGSGYRVVVNNGRGAGQTVWHLHFHLLGGTRLPLASGVALLPRHFGRWCHSEKRRLRQGICFVLHPADSSTFSVGAPCANCSSDARARSSLRSASV